MKPFVIMSLLHRKKLDPNRKVEEACNNNCPIAVAAWHEYHSKIEVAVAYSIAKFGFCHVFDIHGQSHRAATEFGYLLRTSDFCLSDSELDAQSNATRSSLARLMTRSKLSLSAMLRGPESLGGLLEAAGHPAFPSPQSPKPSHPNETYFWGSYTTWRFGLTLPPADGTTEAWGAGQYPGCNSTQVKKSAWRILLCFLSVECIMLPCRFMNGAGGDCGCWSIFS